MALFKICRGAETNLPTTLTSGYCYFCTDTTNFYIDYTDTYGALTRAKIASKYADKLRYTEDGNFIELDPTDIVTKSNYETAIGVATSDKNGLMSSSDKTKLDGVESGAQVNVQADWNQSDTTAKDYIKNKICYDFSGWKTVYSEVLEVDASDAIVSTFYPSYTYAYSVTSTSFMAGSTIRIAINDTYIDFVVPESSNNQWGEYTIGNYQVAIVGVSNASSGPYIVGIGCKTDISGSTFSIQKYVNETKTIDEKYLPTYLDKLAYCTCTTVASTQAKVAACSVGQFTLTKGQKAVVKFSYANTAVGPTLNIGSTGAKTIYWHGQVLPSTQYWEAGAVLEFVYNGSQFELIGIAKDNSKEYSVATASSDGLFSATDKAKLDGISSGATAVSIDTTLTQSGQAADAKAVGDELAKKLDNPQTAAVGDVLTVEEVDENGKPTKWKTAPAAAEQVQSDWYEQDSTKPSYIKNGFAKLKFTKKKAPSRQLTAEGYYQYTVSTPSGKSSYVCYQLSVLIAPDTYDTIYVDIVPTDETATLNNIKVAIEEFGKRYDITNVTVTNGHSRGVDYLTPKDNPVVVYICGVIANSEIDARFLPSPDFNTDYAGIFKASPVNGREELRNLKPVKYYNTYTNPDATTLEKFPSLYAQKEIQTFDTFDFNTTVLGQSSGDKFSLCYTSNIGNACTELGITEDDLPIMSYLMDYLVGNRPLGTYYIETATNKRFIATYRYGTTTWSDIKKLSGGSSGGSSAFYINITSTTDDSGNTTYSADKTADEIIAAYESGAVIIGVYGKIYMQCLMHIANPHELALTFAVQDFDPVQGVMAQWWCSVDINKDNKEMDVSYEQNVTIPDEGIFFIVNNDTVQTSGSFEDIFHHIVSAVEIPKSLDMILIKGAEIYNLSRLEINDNGILFKFDDVANSKTYIVFGDSNNEAFTYSEEPLSTSVNITYNEETGNLQIGG